MKLKRFTSHRKTPRRLTAVLLSVLTLVSTFAGVGGISASAATAAKNELSSDVTVSGGTDDHTAIGTFNAARTYTPIVTPASLNSTFLGIFSGRAINSYKVTVGGKDYVGFCIDLPSTGGSNGAWTSDMNSAQSDAKNYVNALNGSGAGAAISLAISCGYGQNQSNPYHLASQIIVWEILGGVRSYTYPYDVKGSYRDAVSPYSSYCTTEDFQSAYDRTVNRMKVMGGEANDGMAKALTAGITLKWDAATQKYTWTKTVNRVNGVSYDFSLENADGVKLTTTNGDGKVTLTLTSDKANIKNVKLKVTKRVMDAGKASDMKVFSSTQLSCGQVTVSGFKNVPREYTVPVSAKDSSIVIRVWKTSANPELTEGNSCYSLDGAVYGVFTDSKGTKPYEYKGENVTITLKEQSDKKKAYGDSIPIPKGTYYIKELTAPQGYVLDKLDHITCYLRELGSLYIPTRAARPRQRIFTVYYLRETTPLDEYQPLEYAIKAVIDTEGNVKLYKPTAEGYEEITDTVSLRLDSSEDDTELPRITNKPVRIGTTALSALTNAHQAFAVDKSQITDTVTYEGLTPDKEYTLEGVLMDKATGKELLINGEKVTAVKTFTPIADNGETTVTFTLDASALSGKSVVVFETLKYNNETMVEHKNIEDAGQTVTFIKPNLVTSAIDKETTLQVGYANSKTTILDSVEYSNVIANVNYTLKTTVADSETGKEIGTPATKSFTPNSDSGTVETEITVDSSELKGKKITVYEELICNDVVVATHKDKDDQRQQVEFVSPSVKTTATDSLTRTHYAYALESLSIIDNVQLTGLISGQEYTVEGQLVEKSNGNVISTGEETFTARKGDVGFNMAFDFDASKYAGQDLVVFETLKYKGKVIAEHKDLEDTEQAVTILNPNVETTAVDKSTNLHSGISETTSVVTDKVDLSGLIEGRNYKLKGQLINKETGEPIDVIEAEAYWSESVSGQELGNVMKQLGADVSEDKKTVTVSFTARGNDETVYLDFTFDALTLGNVTTVAFETLNYQGTDIAIHTDLEDSEQTVDLLGHGDIELKKIDETGSPIEGVSFSLYKDEACKNLAENCYDTFDNENGTNLGEDVSFKDVKTDEDGLAKFDDLLYGTYWIKETATLNGKQLLTKVIKAELTKDGTLLSVNGKPLDLDDEGIAQIENVDIPEMPETGGIGNTIFGIIGLALIAAGAVFLINRKSNKGKSEV